MPPTLQFAVRDPFHPVLKSGSPTIQLTPEQDQYVKAILEVCCSDSAFAKKAYAALYLLLTNGEEEAIPPVITSLVPDTLPTDLGLVTITVRGTGFTADSVILHGALALVTTMNSDIEVAGTVESIGMVPVSVPITVDNLGVVSNSMNFTWTVPV